MILEVRLVVNRTVTQAAEPKRQNIALILGFLTGIAAFFGTFMNINYLLAGSVSNNPILFALGTWLVLA